MSSFRIGALALMMIGALVAGCTDDQHNWQRPEIPVATPAALIDASDPQPISEIAARYGDAYWERDTYRDPRVRAHAGDIPYMIEFYGCSEGRDCTDLRLVARFPPDQGDDRRSNAERIKAWNGETRFGKAWIDTEGAIILEMNLNLGGGVTRQNLDLSFDWWVLSQKQFLRTIGT